MLCWLNTNLRCGGTGDGGVGQETLVLEIMQYKKMHIGYVDTYTRLTIGHTYHTTYAHNMPHRPVSPTAYKDKCHSTKNHHHGETIFAHTNKDFINDIMISLTQIDT